MTKEEMLKCLETVPDGQEIIIAVAPRGAEAEIKLGDLADLKPGCLTVGCLTMFTVVLPGNYRQEGEGRWDA